MHLTITTTAGKLEYDLTDGELPEGYRSPEALAHVFADVIDGDTKGRQIVQHTAPRVWTAINSDHVVAVDITGEQS